MTMPISIRTRTRVPSWPNVWTAARCSLSHATMLLCRPSASVGSVWTSHGGKQAAPALDDLRRFLQQQDIAAGVAAEEQQRSEGRQAEQADDDGGDEGDRDHPGAALAHEGQPHRQHVHELEDEQSGQQRRQEIEAQDEPEQGCRDDAARRSRSCARAPRRRASMRRILPVLIAAAIVLPRPRRHGRSARSGVVGRGPGRAATGPCVKRRSVRRIGAIRRGHPGSSPGAGGHHVLSQMRHIERRFGALLRQVRRRARGGRRAGRGRRGRRRLPARCAAPPSAAAARS